MCGILLQVRRCQPHDDDTEPSLPAWWAAAAHGIDARGPDAPGIQLRRLDDGKRHVYTVHASVLALRGADVVAQPMQSNDGSLLFLWNGEVFETGDEAFDLSGHDGLQLFAAIQKGMARELERQGRRDALKAAFSEVLSAIDGPFAVALVDLQTSTVFYGRDTLGRRSLLLVEDGDSLVLSSAACKDMANVPVKEVSCASLWCLEDGKISAIARGDTKYTRRSMLRDLADETVASMIDVQAAFLKVLSESVRVRVQGTRLRSDKLNIHADVAVLFSGGIDCTTLALLAHHHLPADEPIDLLNVAFENPRTLHSRASAANTTDPETASAHGTQAERSATAYDVPDRKTGRASLAELQRLAPHRQWRFIAIDVPFAEYTATRPEIEALLSPNASVMDLSIGAALYFASRGQGTLDRSSEPYRTHARVLLSGLGADEQLGGYTRHRRAWERARVQTLPDDAPAAAATDVATPLTKRQALVAELQLDLDRLPTRNLGRDDRVLSASGREARYPFLARSVIDFLAGLPAEAKVDLDAPPGTGDKALLRRVAAEQIGLTQTAALTKRAIQFGARSAKMDASDGRTKGQDSLRNGGT